MYDDIRSSLCVRSMECFGLTGGDKVRFWVMDEEGGMWWNVYHVHISSEI